ncbi:MAG: glutamate-5-semialdehyde dehydrogenase [Pseudomarimonas sp.]
MSESALLTALRAARASLPQLIALSAAERNDAVMAMATGLRSNAGAVMEANSRDLAAGIEAGLSPALLDRLRLDATRLDALAEALATVAALPDPLADSAAPSIHANGLRRRQKPAPLGVVAMIYESRPNVTAEAAALCFKAGNACVLRGGREARHSNLAIAGVLKQALHECAISADCVQVLDDPDRSQLAELLTRDDLIDLVIPRGGEALIRHVVANSRIPVIRHYKGVCHLFVDRSADPAMAQRLLIDGKVSRPGVCNALECLLVHRDIATTWLPAAAAVLIERGVELRGCSTSRAIIPAIAEAADEDWGYEFLAPVLAIRVVDDLDHAMAHIRRYGSNHTEVICSADVDACARFVNEVDASAVVVNASSRFNDGGELGMGAEIGISTSKLHAYGPMGLTSLTTRKWVIEGEGQVRHLLA